MGRWPVTYLLAMVAAVAYGCNWVLQQHEAAQAPAILQLHPVRLLEHVIRRPLWVVGLIALLGGSAAQEGALTDGSLPVIEALLVLDLVFALLLANKMSHRTVTRVQWLGAVAICVGLVGFLAAGDPTPGHGLGSNPRWVLVAIAVGGAVAGLLFIAWHTTGAVRAASCATAAAILFGLSDGLSKSAFSVLPRGVDDLVAAWQFYALIGVAVVAVAASQIAYNAAPLVVSLPSLAVGEPVVGVLVGIFVLHVQFRTNTAALAIEAVAAALIASGSWIVTRAPVLNLHYPYPHLHRPGAAPRPRRDRTPSPPVGPSR
jgi:hypothetical protein